MAQQAGALPPDDLRWLQKQGFRSLAEVPRVATWYRQDGSSTVGHADAYHLHRYRLRGMTLKPSTITPEPVHRGPMPLVAKKVLRVLGEDRRWEGSASDLADRCGVSPFGIGRALTAPKVSAALASAGVVTRRGCRGNGRVLRLKRRLHA